MEFTIRITGLDQLVSKLHDYPAISLPILQKTLTASWAILGKNTNRDTVPWKTGFLVQTFSGWVEPLKAYWYPTASYASFVQFGTEPHIIRAVNVKALWWDGADHPVKSVNHPGTKPNDYMGRIVKASEDEINATFGKALQQILAKIAA